MDGLDMGDNLPARREGVNEAAARHANSCPEAVPSAYIKAAGRSL
jgi:hypothetical protein